MRTGQVNAVIVGAERIARNGDFANKIGTYARAVDHRENGIPFYRVAAPWSTFNTQRPDGRAIPVEERAEEEVLELAGRRIAPQKSHARNPAFDVTPAKYVTAFVTPRGVVRPRELAARASCELPRTHDSPRGSSNAVTYFAGVASNTDTASLSGARYPSTTSSRTSSSARSSSGNLHPGIELKVLHGAAT